MIPRHTLHVLEQLARLRPTDLTAFGPVWLGTEVAREILAALEDADTLRRARELLASGAAPHVVAVLLATPTIETVDLKVAHDPQLVR